MSLVDTNLLLHAYYSNSAEHEGARRWLEAVFSKPEPVRVAWASLLAEVRHD